MPISGSGNVSFSSTLLLFFVLLAPNLSNNLLSICKITKNLNCYVTFHSTHCVFQNNLAKTTIGIGKKRGGLYYLEQTRVLQPKFDRILQVIRETFDREKIMLWQYLFLNSIFSSLKTFVSSLIQNCSSF